LPHQEVNWLTVITTLIVGLPAILTAAAGLIWMLWKIYLELRKNTATTENTAGKVKETLDQREAKVDSALKEAKEEAARNATKVAAVALSDVKKDLAGIAKTINGHTDARVEDATKAAFLEGKQAATNEAILQLNNAILEIREWQTKHGELDERNMSEIRELLTQLITKK
jgi:hypothetical protein